MERKIFKTEIGGREVSVEIGAYCGQANGSCLIRCGETVVLTNATMAKTPDRKSTRLNSSHPSSSRMPSSA